MFMRRSFNKLIVDFFQSSCLKLSAILLLLSWFVVVLPWPIIEILFPLHASLEWTIFALIKLVCGEEFDTNEMQTLIFDVFTFVPYIRKRFPFPFSSFGLVSRGQSRLARQDQCLVDAVSHRTAEQHPESNKVAPSAGVAAYPCELLFGDQNFRF
uniref:Uncharacterized protein n=1 Tax=Panagrellus redivivus TaxID=6233 RepID=A0A7E4V0A6_PANRE